MLNDMYCGPEIEFWLFAVKFWKWLGIPIGIFLFLNPGILDYIFFWSNWIYTPGFLEFRTILFASSCILISVIIWIYTINKYIKKKKVSND